MPSDKIGPYRLEGRLGAGGMGEVYEAWDERLERRVALKRLRSDGPEGADPQGRERLRREARSAARLSHPSIVQVHDLVETADGDWIVLERVEGKTLAALLRDGPLDLARVLPLARQIAEGLAEAHGRGILHRDLKTENVVVTPGGQAKILDFGLAKSYWPPAREASLSIPGGIAGTHRAMSPEQANGLDLDPRSDLFSFGTLLYETVTGVSPFAAATPVETLHRVCAHQQPPAAELNPAVPAELSTLIDQLLEKDRERRPRNATETADRLAEIQESVLQRGSGRPALARTAAEPTVVGAPPSSPSYAPVSRRGVWRLAIAVLVVALAAAGLSLWLGRSREPLVVAVAEPRVGLGAGRADAALAAGGIHSALLRGLVSLSGVAPLTPERDVEGEPPRTLASTLAADEVLASRLDCEGRICRVSLSRLQGVDGRLLWVDDFEVPIDDFALMDTAAVASLRRGFDGHPPRPGAPELDVASEDYARYVRLDQAFRNHDEKASLDPLLAEAEAIRRGSPRFVEAYLLEASLARDRFFDSREPADLDRCFQLLREARRLAPGDPRPLKILGTAALIAERLPEAEEAARELERQAPGDTQALVLRALVLERRGRGKEALERMRTAAERRPSAGNLLELANLEYRQGETGAARRTLDGMIERFPRDRKGRSLLAQLELGSGSPERAAELYAELVRLVPTFADLSNLGLAQLLLGRYAEAAASFRRAYDLAPISPISALNLADAEYLQGRKAEAEALYRRVLDLVAQDPAPTFWQNLTIRAQALAHLGQHEEAVAAIQQALRAAPDNPQVAYEASLVYAVVGDVASARVNADRALAAGFDRRWFTFPWFAPLDGSTARRPAAG